MSSSSQATNAPAPASQDAEASVQIASSTDKMGTRKDEYDMMRMGKTQQLKVC